MKKYFQLEANYNKVAIRISAKFVSGNKLQDLISTWKDIPLPQALVRGTVVSLVSDRIQRTISLLAINAVCGGIIHARELAIPLRNRNGLAGIVFLFPQYHNQCDRLHQVAERFSR